METFISFLFLSFFLSFFFFWGGSLSLPFFYISSRFLFLSITSSKMFKHIIGCLVLSGSERYGDICTKFATGETKPDENNGEWFCLKEDSYEYCQRYSCPDTACEDPKIPDEGVCKYCPGKPSLF